MRVKRVLFCLLFLVLMLTACTILDGTNGVEEPVPVTQEPATPVVAVDPQITPVVEIQPTPTPEAVGLKIWIPPEIANRTEEGAQILAEQLREFNDKYPDVTLMVEQKQARGTGGILSYLRTGRAVAPTVLPDVVALPTELLPTAGNENLIFAMDETIDPSAMDPLFPSASQLSQPQESILGYPFALSGVTHIVFNSNVMTSTLPLTWERLISNPERNMVMPAGGSDSALLALQFYLDAGGQVENDLGQPIMELDPLKVALNALQDGRESGFIIEQSSRISTEDQAWQIFLGGGANIVRTSADHFLGENTAGLPVEYTVTPGIDRPLTPLTTGWAWAVSTPDEVQQALAMELIQDLVTAQNLGAWSQESDILPSRKDALETWTVNEAYTDFIEQELDRADPLPVNSSSKFITVLGDAAFQVISGAKSADEAAEDALEAFQS
ncbi:MAG: extracellular solute-binding protein [Candidatus Promineifilaceae bacterium]|nr:extracellular solute-binding protein [Candidatus Promineifilaceae bacterium]